MAKRVNDQQREDVLRLHFIDRLSSRGIAAQLGMARRTVRHIIQGRRPSEHVQRSSERPSSVSTKTRSRRSWPRHPR